MSDKKVEDVEAGPGSGTKEMDPFLSRTPSHRARAAADKGALADFWAQIDHHPGASILSYCLSSISMTVVNKYVVSGSSWNLNFFYLAVQAIVCTAAIIPCKQFGIIKDMAPFDSQKAKSWLPVSLVFVGMIYTSTKALQFLSVPVYTIFKNLTIIVIAYGEVLWFGGSVTPIALLSFGLMVLSSVIAAWADIQSVISGSSSVHDSAATLSTLNAGYAWMGLNVFCSASYVLGTRKYIKKLNFKDRDTMLYNNVLSIPLLISCSLIAEDWSATNLARNFPVETRNSLFIGMIYSGLAAIFISYCSAWCIRVTSSTTYSMVGALNKLPLAISGLVFFDAPVSLGSVSAIFVGFVSGLVYTWAKVRPSARGSTLPTSQPVMSASAQSNRDAANS